MAGLASARELGVDVQAAAGLGSGSDDRRIRKQDVVGPAVLAADGTSSGRQNGNGLTDPTLLGRISELGGRDPAFQLFANVVNGNFGDGAVSSSLSGFRTLLEITEGNNVLVTTRRERDPIYVEDSHFLRDPVARVTSDYAAIELIEPVQYEHKEYLVLREINDEGTAAKAKPITVDDAGLINAVRIGPDGITAHRINPSKLDRNASDSYTRSLVDIVDFAEAAELPPRRQTLLDGEDPTGIDPYRGVNEGVEWLNKRF